MIDEVGVFNKGISADTLNDIASKGIEKLCLSLPRIDSRQSGDPLRHRPTIRQMHKPRRW